MYFSSFCKRIPVFPYACIHFFVKNDKTRRIFSAGFTRVVFYFFYWAEMISFSCCTMATPADAPIRSAPASSMALAVA